MDMTLYRFACVARNVFDVANASVIASTDLARVHIEKITLRPRVSSFPRATNSSGRRETLGLSAPSDQADRKGGRCGIWWGIGPPQLG